MAPGVAVRLGGVGTARPGGHTFAAFGEGFDHETRIDACVIALGLVLGSGGAAMAGEVNGNGDDIPGRGQRRARMCAFSGLDTPDAIENPTGSARPENQCDDVLRDARQPEARATTASRTTACSSRRRSQSIRRRVNPGMACRGNVRPRG